VRRPTGKLQCTDETTAGKYVRFIHVYTKYVDVGPRGMSRCNVESNEWIDGTVCGVSTASMALYVHMSMVVEVEVGRPVRIEPLNEAIGRVPSWSRNRHRQVTAHEIHAMYGVVALHGLPYAA
jgi:hypothetical protein